MDSLASLARAAGRLLAAVSPAPIDLAAPAPRSPDALRACLADLVAAYPERLARVDERQLHWRDGHVTPLRRFTRPRTAAEILADPDIVDIFAWAYPLGQGAAPGRPLGDPGRPRPTALFERLYGDCHKGEVQRRLVDVRWAGGHKVRFTKANGAADALGRVARALERLGPAIAKHLWPLSGTFNCRAIAGTRSPSMHAYGAAIDLSSRGGGYWRWGPDRGALPPIEIIQAFERNGFIWGGKWAHFDTFHFEFRPEIIRAARGGVG